MIWQFRTRHMVMKLFLLAMSLSIYFREGQRAKERVGIILIPVCSYSVCLTYHLVQPPQLLHQLHQRSPCKKQQIHSSRVIIVWWTIRLFHCLLASLIKRLARWQCAGKWSSVFLHALRYSSLVFPNVSFNNPGLMTASLTQMGTNSLISPLRCSWSPD